MGSDIPQITDFCDCFVTPEKHDQHVFTIKTGGYWTLMKEKDQASVTALRQTLHVHGTRETPHAVHRRGTAQGPHSTVAWTTISGFSMSFLLWTILNSSCAGLGFSPPTAWAAGQSVRDRDRAEATLMSPHTPPEP